MNLSNPSIAQFAALLAQHDDKRNRRLVVHHNGDVDIVCPDGILPSVFASRYKFYYEIWAVGNDYTGPDAAQDDEHVKKYYNSLIDNWNNGKNSIVDFV